MPKNSQKCRAAPADGMEIEFRSDLNDKIIEIVGKKELTHADVARLAHTSRTRVTAILNRNTHDISTDLMLRVLASLGVQAKLQFKSAAKFQNSSARAISKCPKSSLSAKCFPEPL